MLLFPAIVPGGMAVEEEGPLAIAAFGAFTACEPGDALAGAPLNGFRTKTNAETIASPTSKMTE